MKKLLYIVLLFLWKLSAAQDSCRPDYKMPVQTLQVAEKVNIAYVEKGKGDPILFIHGLGGNLSHWLKQVEGLSSNYHCIAIDLPGYGHSDKEVKTEKNQLSFYADVLHDFIRKKGLQKVTLAGHSMGGQVAMIIAHQYPGIVSKLVLAAPAGLETFSQPEAQMMLYATPPSVFEKQDETVIRQSFQRNFF